MVKSFPSLDTQRQKIEDKKAVMFMSLLPTQYIKKREKERVFMGHRVIDYFSRTVH
jgi:hypothetical protein